MKNSLPEILIQDKFNEWDKEFRKALYHLDKTLINSNNAVYLINIYYSAIQMNIRYRVLKVLYDFDFINLKEFFTNAYKREQYLDMKIYALRGLANFIGEKDIAKMLKQFNKILLKQHVSNPYNYQQYELLRGKTTLPYLVAKYNYNCFKETLEQVNKQYDSMPDAFKGHFTTDENGELVLLRSNEEIRNMLDNFYREESEE